jgi:hypothetical protein
MKRFLLSLTLAVSSLVAGSPALPQVGPGYASPGVYWRVCTSDYGSLVNVRTAPSKSGYILSRIPSNSYVRVRSRFISQFDGMWWTRVTTPGGVSGFVRDDYLCVY